jgi:hypothetical protein
LCDAHKCDDYTASAEYCKKHIGLQRRFVRYKPFEVGHLPWLSANGCVLRFAALFGLRDARRFDGAHQRLAGRAVSNVIAVAPQANQS